jgi:peptidoglycan L-alanyl-D-glutamate endopeptidase CwlK
MPYYIKKSSDKLESCHQDLQTIFNYVIKYFDNTVICGHRTNKEQWELYRQGRDTKGDIITHKDGTFKKSLHQEYPSMAIDVIPYPIEWSNTDRMRYFIGYVKCAAQMLYDYGAIEHLLKSGLDWDNDTVLKDQRFNDFPHFELYIPRPKTN